MKHAFFGHPAGAPGIALLFYRLSAACWVGGIGGRLTSHDLKMGFFVYLAALALAGGIFTRVVAAACTFLTAFDAFAVAPYPILCSGAIALSLIALLLIGPGAYSMDAALSGRRTIHLPR
jgi:hypothetical protein